MKNTKLLSLALLISSAIAGSAHADCLNISGKYHFSPDRCKVTGAGKTYNEAASPIPVRLTRGVEDDGSDENAFILDNSDFEIEQNDCTDFKVSFTANRGGADSTNATDYQVGSLKYELHPTSSVMQGSFGYIGAVAIIGEAYRDHFDIRKNDDGSLTYHYYEASDVALFLINVTTITCTFPKS
jgi:hypothetical protein